MTSEIQLCHFDSQQPTVQITLQCSYKTLGFLRGGPMHSSNSSNTGAQLSMGWSGVNFTVGRIRVCNCSELLHCPWHAYSVAGPWATTEGERASAPCPKPNPGLFTYFFLLPHSPLFLFLSLFASLCLASSSPSFSNREESRGDWLVQLELRGRRGPGHRALGACKAGRIPLKCCFKCP